MRITVFVYQRFSIRGLKIAIKITVSNGLIEHKNQSKLMGTDFGGAHLFATRVNSKL